MSDRRLFERGSWPETSRIAELLRQETIGGVLLIAAALLALVAANVGDTYAEVRDTVVGPSALHLDLSLGTWAADGLLAIFFFVVGLELKREFVAGDLRDPRRAAVPIVAAVGGMALPAASTSRSTSGRTAAKFAAGPSRPRPTSRSPWRCSRSSAPTCRRPCARSC